MAFWPKPRRISVEQDFTTETYVLQKMLILYWKKGAKCIFFLFCICHSSSILENFIKYLNLFLVISITKSFCRVLILGKYMSNFLSIVLIITLVLFGFYVSGRETIILAITNRFSTHKKTFNFSKNCIRISVVLYSKERKMQQFIFCQKKLLPDVIYMYLLLTK